jgi:hypothetical protein
MPPKRKRGRGLMPRSLGSTKPRLESNLQKIEDMSPRIPPPEDYGTTMENIRKDSSILFNYAKTPEDKLKYTQIIFKLGQMYLWYPWKVGTLTDDKGKEYILAKAMQAEQDQYTFIDILRKKKEKETRDKLLKQTLDKLGATDLFFKKPHPSGLKIRIPRRKPKPVRDVEEARMTLYKADKNLSKFTKFYGIRQQRYNENRTDENKAERKRARRRWKRAKEEYLEAKRDSIRKEKAYEKWKNRSRAPRAKAFKKYK